MEGFYGLPGVFVCNPNQFLGPQMLFGFFFLETDEEEFTRKTEQRWRRRESALLSCSTKWDHLSAAYHPNQTVFIPQPGKTSFLWFNKVRKMYGDRLLSNLLKLLKWFILPMDEWSPVRNLFFYIVMFEIYNILITTQGNMLIWLCHICLENTPNSPFNIYLTRKSQFGLRIYVFI